MTPKALSREIKFRAFYKEENCMFYSCEVLEWVIWEFSCGEIKVVVQELGTEEKEWNVKDLPIMQFTGLFDKNGKGIYEGDIMKVLDRDWVDAERDTNIYIVYWYKGGFMLVNKTGIEEKEKSEPNIYNKDWLETTLYKEYGRDKFEIIGNIYETPELLTKENNYESTK